MSTDELRDLLQSMPPAMDNSGDRFDAVQRRARRRTRTRTTMTVAAGGLAAAAVLAGTAAVITNPSPSSRTGTDLVATEPPVPSRAVQYEDSGPLPGETRVVNVGKPVEINARGTRTVDLGKRPAGVSAANVSVVCLTAGRIVYPDGASLVCDGPASSAEVDDPRSANYALIDLDPGQAALRFEAGDEMRWKLVATYARTVTSEWGINARGETFGVMRDGKSPDLMAVYTTEGKQGYAYSNDLNGPVPTSPADVLAGQEAVDGGSRSVPVYESDGETVIGEFRTAP